jgi:uncharacterized protein YraI
MRRFLVALAALAGALLMPAAAEAADGYTTGSVNMRAGPGTQYPRIMVLPRGAPVEVYGCLRGYSWCDVGYYRERGWVSSRYLSVFYDDRQVYVPYRPRVAVPYLTFEFGYWDRWYYDRPWYREWRRKDRNDRPNWDRNDPPLRNDPPPDWNRPGRIPDRGFEGDLGWDRPRPQQPDRYPRPEPGGDFVGDGGYVPGGDPRPRCPRNNPNCYIEGGVSGDLDGRIDGGGGTLFRND